MAELKKPFAGLRVADFAWVGVGPTVSKYLADHGAEVIRIESSTYPETLRRVGPFVDDRPDLNNSGYYANFNSSKLCMSVDLKHARGPELVKRLIAECDVVTESFTPGIMARYGLDYESLRAVRPDLVMISMPLYGQTGPWASYMGYGHVLQAASGYNHLTGWPDAEPIGTGIAYTDFLVPHIATIALIAALDYRRRTGVGQYLDFGQMEAAVHGLGTAILDWTANGHDQIRLGQPRPGSGAARLLSLPRRPLHRARLRDGEALGGAQGGPWPAGVVRHGPDAPAAGSGSTSRPRSTGTFRTGSKTSPAWMASPSTTRKRASTRRPSASSRRPK